MAEQSWTYDPRETCCEFERHLKAVSLKLNSIETYDDRTIGFLRWLVGGYTPQGSARLAMPENTGRRENVNVRATVTALAILAIPLAACGSSPSAEVIAVCDAWEEAAAEHEDAIGRSANELDSFTATVLAAGIDAEELGGDYEELGQLAIEGGAEILRLDDQPLPRSGDLYYAINTARNRCISDGAWDLCEGLWKLTGRTEDDVCGQ